MGTTSLIDVWGCLISWAGCFFQLGERCSLGFRVCLGCSQPLSRVGSTELKSGPLRQGIRVSTHQAWNPSLGIEGRQGASEGGSLFYASAT